MEEPTGFRTDGVGTKLKLHLLWTNMTLLESGLCSNVCNDIACAGGEPLFLTHCLWKRTIRKIAEIVKGVAEGCSQSSAPSSAAKLHTGDVLIGMASSGVHSNGFSLVRKVFEMTKESLDTYYDELGTTLGEALIAPTKIYVKALKSIKDAGVKIHACSHITGGGFYENVPRMLKEGTRAVIEKDSYPVLPIFKLLAKTGDIEEKMMYNTYNMGLGMVLAVDPADVDKTMEAIKAAGETPYVVGHIEAGEKGVTLC